MSIMSIISAIFSPAFLVNNIELIAFISSVMILVIFDDFVFGKFVFPLVDFLKYIIFKHVGAFYEKKGIKSWWAKASKKYFSEIVATVLIIFYCYLGYAILGIYFLEPILQRLKAIILIIVIFLFFIANYLINNPRMRRKFFGYGVYHPEKKK